MIFSIHPSPRQDHCRLDVVLVLVGQNQVARAVVVRRVLMQVQDRLGRHLAHGKDGPGKRGTQLKEIAVEKCWA